MISQPTELSASYSEGPKVFLILLVKLTVTLGSLYFIFFSVSTEALGQRFAHMQVGWFAVALLVFWFVQFVSALRCAYIVRALGAQLGWAIAVRAHFVGLWFNQVLPTGFGGDVVKIGLIKAQVGLGVAMRAVAFDRVSGLMILMFMLMVQLPLYLTHLASVREAAWIALVSSAVFLSVIFLARLSHALLGKSRVWFGLKHVVPMLAELWLFSRRQPLWEQFWTSLVVHVGGIVVFGLIGHALSVVVDLLSLFLMVPLVFLAAQMPFSFAGWGLREVGAIWVLATIGISGEDALAMSVGFGVLTLIAGLPGLILFVLRR